MLLQLAVAQRRDIVALEFRILPRILLLLFAHCEEASSNPLHSRLHMRHRFRCLVHGSRDQALELRFDLWTGHVLVHLLRFFAPLVALLGCEGLIGGALAGVKVGEGEFEGLAFGFLGGGGGGF